MQDTSDSTFLDLGGDKEAGFQAARDALIEDTYRAIAEIGAQKKLLLQQLDRHAHVVLLCRFCVPEAWSFYSTGRSCHKKSLAGILLSADLTPPMVQAAS